MFNLANILTGMNLVCGVISVILSFSGQLDLAVYAIFIGAFFDFCDGFVARKLNLMSELGKQLDSLSDLVTFGVAPGILMFIMIIIGVNPDNLIESQSGNTLFYDYYVVQEFFTWVNGTFYEIPNTFDASIKWLPFTALIVPFFALFRLAKFNLDNSQSTNFIGFPTPLVAILLSFFPLYFFLNMQDWNSQPELVFWIYDCYSLAIITFGLSILMLSRIPLMSLKFQKLQSKENRLKIILILISVVSIPFLKVLSIPFIITLYFIISIYHSIKLNHNEI
jgi:CDP-diacylglycerol--serine O-phosphatidyltransferase